MLHRGTSDQYARVFFIDNIFVKFGGRLFQQIVDIHMGTNCAPLLADLFLLSYESELAHKRSQII